MCSRRKEREHSEEWFSIFNQVVEVGFVVKQRLSEDLREVWESEETSVAGAEWVKRRAAGQGPRADREGLDVAASGDMLRPCAQSEVGGGGGWLWVGLCPPEKMLKSQALAPVNVTKSCRLEKFTVVVLFRFWH